MIEWVGAAAALFASWIGTRSRPAARAARKARKAVRKVEREWEAVERLRAKAEARLSERAARYARGAAEERLKSIAVDELRTFGAQKVRWGVLHDAGIHTVHDLRGKRRRELERLDGIGDVSAQRILAAKAALLKANREEPITAPRLESEQTAAREAVRAARDVIGVRDAVAEVRSELEDYVEEVRPRLERIRRHTGLFHGLFDEERRNAKREAIDEADELAAEVAKELAAGGLVVRSAAARADGAKQFRRRIATDELDRDHERRFAEYSSLIEAALPGRKIHGASGARGGLPEEIVRRVEAVQLDTRLLRVTLRGYQEFGTKYVLAQERSLLGDEMGLGKTVQALAAFCHLARATGASQFLVVCPASVLHNWIREVRAHTFLPAILLHGDERAEAFEYWRAEGGVGVTSFRTLETLLESALTSETPWPAVAAMVVDEAHYVKNPSATRTKTVASVAKPLRHVLYLTGTPFENRLDEFRVLVSQLQEPVAAKLASSLTATGDLVIGRHSFQQAVAPVYLRRNQEDVLRELPERIDNEEWVELSKAEHEVYVQAVEREDIMAMRRAATIGDGGGGTESAKLERLEELLDEYRESGQKVLVFSFFLDVLKACARRFEVEGTITGATPPADRQALIDAFGARPGHTMLLAQIQAGGVGLNIQAASVVCLLEPQWKPSTEEQAIARAHRMGQTRTVLVHRFFAKDSVDERMREVLAEKAELFDAFARESLIKDASPNATEASLARKVIEAEKSRLEGELHA